MSLEVERSDYMLSPGRTGILTIGILEFAVNTADGIALAFTVTVRGWSCGWTFYAPPDPEAA